MKKWEIILLNGTIIDEVTDLAFLDSGCLSVWRNGKRGLDVLGEAEQPDLVLAAHTWIAYR